MFLYMSKKNKNAQQNNMNQMNYNPLISNVEQKGILETNKKELKRFNSTSRNRCFTYKPFRNNFKQEKNMQEQ